MKVARTFAIMAIVMLILDLLAINFIVMPMFNQYLGDWLTPAPRLWAAGLFYVIYLIGVYILAIQPSATATQALTRGALLGLVAYGTYELTNMATLQRWAMPMLIADLAWGTTLTAIVAWAGHKARRA